MVDSDRTCSSQPRLSDQGHQVDTTCRCQCQSRQTSALASTSSWHQGSLSAQEIPGPPTGGPPLALSKLAHVPAGGAEPRAAHGTYVPVPSRALAAMQPAVRCNALLRSATRCSARVQRATTQRSTWLQQHAACCTHGCHSAAHFCNSTAHLATAAPVADSRIDSWHPIGHVSGGGRAGGGVLRAIGARMEHSEARGLGPS
jgi:hypothetical protein